MEEQLHLNVVKFPKNAYIIMEDKQRIAEQFFIIMEGKVHLSRESQVVAEEQGGILKQGDFFGVVSTMSGHSHIETAQSLTDVTLISVRREQFGQLIQNNAPVAIKILLQFSRRMRYLNEALTRLTFKKNAAVGAEHLFVVAEYYAKQNQFNLAYYAYQQYIKYCPGGENIQIAQDHLKKITSYVKTDKLKIKTNEMIKTYPEGVMIFSEGEPGEEVFIIRSGSVKIAKVVENNEVLLEVLKAGDIFGEQALLESKPRGAGAMTCEECEFMVVNRTNFEQMIKTQPQLIARLTTLLAERLWMVYKKLANTQIPDPLGRMFDMLLILIEKQGVDLSIKQPYTFDFGPKELINMVGLSQSDGNAVTQKLLQNRQIEVIKNKITVSDVVEFSRQTNYHRKMREAERPAKG
jgi:CRP-like cAMP-binding protein